MTYETRLLLHLSELRSVCLHYYETISNSANQRLAFCVRRRTAAGLPVHRPSAYFSETGPAARAKVATHPEQSGRVRGILAIEQGARETLIAEDVAVTWALQLLRTTGPARSRSTRFSRDLSVR